MAAEKNLFLSVYQNRRFDRDFTQVKEILNTKVLGTIKEVEIRFDRYRTTASGKVHKEDKSLPGSGTLHDLGAHVVDQATQLFGMPAKVFGDVFSMKGAEFANDYFEILLYYKDELRVRLKTSVFAKEDHYAYKIFGDKGCFLQERSDDQEAELVAGAIPEMHKVWSKALTQPDGILNYIDAEGNNHREELTSEAGDYMSYYEDIYEHIVFGKALPSPASEVVENMKIIDAVVASNNEEKVIKL